MSRSVTFDNGFTYEDVPQDISDAEALEIAYDNGDVPRPEYNEPNFKQDDSVNKFGMPDLKFFGGLQANLATDERTDKDFARVAVNTVANPVKFIQDIYNGFKDPETPEEVQANKSRTREIAESVFGDTIDYESIIDKETGKVTPVETPLGMGLSVAPFIAGTAAVVAASPAAIPSTVAAVGGGLLADQAFADPDVNIFNVLQDTWPESAAAQVTEFLAADPEDSIARKRMKLLAEGLGIGALVDIGIKTPSIMVRAADKFGTTIEKLTKSQEGDLVIEYLEEARDSVKAADPNPQVVTDGDTISMIRPEEQDVFTETVKGTEQVMGQEASAVKRFAQQFGTSRGFLTHKAYNAFNDSQFARRQDVASAQHVAKRLQKSLDSLTENTNRSTGTVDIGLGGRELTREEVSANIEAAWDQGTDFLKGVKEENRVGTYAGYFNIPKDVAKEVLDARDLIDSMSKKILSSGMANEELTKTLIENSGKYIRRSYKLYENPGYKPTTLDRENAIKFFADQELSGARNITYEDALMMGEVKVKKLLGEDVPDSVQKYYESVRKVNKKVLGKRKEIDPVIRKVMGEITDPPDKVLLSVSKVAQLTSNFKFYSDLRQLGKTGKYIVDNATLRLSSVIQGTGSKLDGMFTTPETLQAIKGVESQIISQTDDSVMSRFLRNMASLKGESQALKTVYSHQTHLRNLLGGAQFGVANGASPFVKSGHEPFKVLANQIKQGGDKSLDEAYERYLRLGIINTNVRVNEFRDLIGTMSDTASDKVLGKISDFAAKGKYGISKSKQKLAENVYTATDDYFKISNFANEMDVLKKAFPSEPLEVLEQEAARIVRDTFPNYDKVPKGIKRLRELPIGSFVAFPSEIARTSYNIVKQSAREMGSRNPQIVMRGRKRLGGFIASMGAWSAAGTGTATLAGFNNDEMEAAKVLSESPWSKDSPINFARIDGEVYTNDTQFLDSYSYIKEPVMAAYDSIVSGETRGEDLDKILLDATMSGLERMLSPFVSESILTQSITDVGFAAFSDDGRSPQGKPIFTPGMTKGEKIGQATEVILMSMVPGSAISGYSLMEAWKQTPHPSEGNTKSLGAELVANMSGVKFRKFEPELALKRSIKTYQRELINTISFKPDFKMTEDALVDRYVQVQKKRYELQRDLYRKVQASQVLLGNSVTIASLLENGMSEQGAGLMLEGKFEPQAPSDKNILDVINKTFSTKRKDLDTEDMAGRSTETTVQKLTRAYSDMLSTSLQTFKLDESGDDGDFRDHLGETRSERGVRLLKDAEVREEGERLRKEKGGLVPKDKEDILRQHSISNVKKGLAVQTEGGLATMRTMGIEIGGKEILIPTVWDGKILDPEDAIERAEREAHANDSTLNEYYPSYKSPEDSTEAAKRLSDEADTRLQKSKGGVVDTSTVKHVPANPESRINKFTGEPFSSTAGEVLKDSGDRTGTVDINKETRLGARLRSRFNKGGEVVNPFETVEAAEVQATPEQKAPISLDVNHAISETIIHGTPLISRGPLGRALVKRFGQR